MLWVPALLLLPAVCLWLTQDTLTIAGYIDPFIYTSYMVNLRSMVERYDLTYYMLRMAAILPGYAIYHIIRPETGFFVLQYLKVLTGCVSMFLIARRYYGAWVAAFCTTALCFSPWYLRSHTWDYVDGFAIDYVLAGLAFALVPRRRQVFWHSCAGFCLALATNSNLYALAIWGAFVPSWVLINWFQSWRMLAGKALTFVAGFVVAYAGLAYAVNHARPGLGPFFELYTLRFAAQLLNGGAAIYFEPLDQFFAKGYFYVLTPVAIAIGGALFVARSAVPERREPKTRVCAALLLYLILIIAVYLVNHYAFHTPRITLPEYFSYALIPSSLFLMAMIGRLSDADPRAARYALAAGTVAIPFLWWLYGTGTLYNGIPYALFIVIFVAFLGASALGVERAMPALVCTLALAIAIPAFFLRTSTDYSVLVYRGDAATERDVYGGALNLIRAVEASSPPSAGSLAFWYAPKPGNHWLLSSVQSTYLDGFTRMLPNPPTVDRTLLTKLGQQQNLVILALTPDEVAADVADLRHAGVFLRPLASSVYPGKDFSYAYAIVRPTNTRPKQPLQP